MKNYLNEKQVSTITGLSLSTLRNHRHLRKGIPYLKISSHTVRYDPCDVESFMQRNRIDPEKLAERKAF